MTTAPIAPVSTAPIPDPAPPLGVQGVTAASPVSFSEMLTNGIDRINEKMANADALVRAFALDDSVPVHQVTYALQEAQSSLELALQIRSRLLDGYQQLMNMQL